MSVSLVRVCSFEMKSKENPLHQFPKVMRSILKVETRKEHSELYGFISHRETDKK